MRAEILFGPMSNRGRRFMRAMAVGARNASVEAVCTDDYSGDASRWLIVYGLGDPRRHRAFRQHREAGGHALNVDLGYWSRGKSEDGRSKLHFLLRVSIDSAHPQDRLFDVPDGARRYARTGGLPLADVSSPDGPVVVVGMGEKGATWAGYRPGEFEGKALRMARERWPSRRIHYRPKVKNLFPYPRVSGFDRVIEDGPIDHALTGASIAICQHSNAAIDAVRLGVPVLAEDGAVVALVGSGIEREPRVIPLEERERFMHALAWWQWTPQEASEGELWRFIRRMCK